MKISRKSPLTGIVTTLDLDITEDQLKKWIRREGLIQDIMPNLTAAEREFILTGYTEDDWKTIFPEEEN